MTLTTGTVLRLAFGLSQTMVEEMKTLNVGQVTFKTAFLILVPTIQLVRLTVGQNFHTK